MAAHRLTNRKRQIRVPIRLDLDGEVAERFVDCKRHLGLKNDSEVIRAAISCLYDRIQKGRYPSAEKRQEPEAPVPGILGLKKGAR